MIADPPERDNPDQGGNIPSPAPKSVPKSVSLVRPETVFRKLAPVAQLDRVLASEAKGRAFESRRARQTTPLQHIPGWHGSFLNKAALTVTGQATSCEGLERANRRW